MRAVDTNVLVRLVTRDDPRQVRAAEAFVARGAWVSHVVLVEATGVLVSVYELEAAAVATAVDMLLNHRDLTVQDAEAVAAALGQYRAKASVSFSDCLVPGGGSKSVSPSVGHLRPGLGDAGRRTAAVGP